jgi:hypothetical protein
MTEAGAPTKVNGSSTYRIIGRLVTNRDQPIENNDSLSYPRKMPNGAVIWPGQIACNYEGCVGIPAGVMMDAGFRVYEQWLCEVRDHRIVQPIARVLGPAFAIAEKPAGASLDQSA